MEKCSLYQSLKEIERLNDEHELQGYFMKRVEKTVRSQGNTMIITFFHTI